MSNTASLKKEYQDRIVPALTKEFGYKTVMQVPVLKKIVINQGLGMAAADKKIIDIAISERYKPCSARWFFSSVGRVR